MIMTTKTTFEIGDEVFWRDPDDMRLGDLDSQGICSGYGTVIAKHGRRGKYRIYVLKMKDGGEVECFQHELN